MPSFLPRLLAPLALVASLALCPVANAETSETNTSFEVKPGPLVLRGASSIPLHFRQVGMEDVAYLPTFSVVDATGSGHGWHLRAAVQGTSSTGVLQEYALHLASPQNADVEGSNAPKRGYGSLLGTKSFTVAFATANTGMGTFTYHGVSITVSALEAVPKGLTLKLSLSSKP